MQTIFTSLFLPFFRQISSVLETPLIFTPLTTTSTTTTTATTNSVVPNNSSTIKPTVVDATVALDINHSFWANLVTRLESNTNVATTSHSMLLVADLTVCDFACVSWPIAAHAEVMNYMVHLVFI